MNIKPFTLDLVMSLLADMNSRIKRTFFNTPVIKIYGIPRGGYIVAMLLKTTFVNYEIVSNIDDADLVVDDLVDSGATWNRVKTHGKPFYVLCSKHAAFSGASDTPHFGNDWIMFPWEGNEQSSETIEDNIARILQYIGEDVSRGGLHETPARVKQAWDHWAGGYKIDPLSLLKTFDDGAENYDEMVVVKNIPFYSHCEHHMAPFFGTASVGYVPNGKIVGLSKLSRVVDALSRRLQVQERLTNQIADVLVTALDPKGVGVRIQARHLCMESRGICQQGHETITSAVRGAMRDSVSARAEFLTLTK